MWWHGLKISVKTGLPSHFTGASHSLPAGVLSAGTSPALAGVAPPEPGVCHPDKSLEDDPEIAQVLAEYHVPVGSSIDGPVEITDSQRGKGYFEKTMRGYEIAKTHGLNCTVHMHIYQ